ncbi:DUF6415 family natural product biosynthesis protein [Streptomyces sp. CBMA29]|uniref:DUF6415 family natural product biosynthesis protein n=1 Tax=Streptomyces sp. CBMA29 TaxID=1896314 RepID=UPI001661BA8B|nr:DUF6415 family natural product biosynthesis protein [Streptomyces sp. CBMA29]MBD0739075.1 hypothetical protein [Streptomyces sp. CBMA29]
MSHSTLAPRETVATHVAADPLVTVADDSTLVTARVLAGLRQRFLLESPGTPSVDLVFEDLESVLGVYAGDLTAAEIATIRPRLHAAFRRIVFVSQRSGSGVSPERLEVSFGLLTQRFPADFPAALVHLRRLAVTVSDLLDELLEDLP